MDTTECNAEESGKRTTGIKGGEPCGLTETGATLAVDGPETDGDKCNGCREQKADDDRQIPTARC